MLRDLAVSVFLDEKKEGQQHDVQCHSVLTVIREIVALLAATPFLSASGQSFQGAIPACKDRRVF